MVTAGNWAGISTDPYEQMTELARALVTKLDSASRGGETFTPCTLYENSKRAKAIQQASDVRRGQELLNLKRAIQTPTPRTPSGGGGGGEHGGDDKKPRRERDADRKPSREPRAVITDADKRGDIVFVGFLKCPTITGDKQPCGAFYRQGVACASMLSKGKCDKDYTLIDDHNTANKATWVAHVNPSPGMEFNAAIVKTIKKVGTEWVVK